MTIIACKDNSANKEIIETEDHRVSAPHTSENILYEGYIDEHGVENLKEVYKLRTLKNNLRVTTLVITSKGGKSLAALEMAEWILGENLNVLVARECYSACANYIFVAARNKLLYDDSKLMWHGSAVSTKGIELGVERAVRNSLKKLSDEEVLRQYSNILEQYFEQVTSQFPEVTRAEIEVEFIKKLRGKEFTFPKPKIADEDVKRVKDFYAKISVDPMIANYGFSQIEASSEDLPNEFYYSLEDLKKMGVKDILLKDGEWTPDYSMPIFKVDSKYVRPDAN